MRRVTRNGVIAVAAASGALAVAMPAFADSAADTIAAGSPGVISGNGVQLPVHVPVNLCGNTVNVVGLLNPAAGNACANKGSAAAPAKNGGGASAHGGVRDSPGVVSGNGVQLPVDLPVNVSGNSVNVVGIANPVIGNESVNISEEDPAPPAEPKPEPPTRHTPPAASHAHPTVVPPARAAQAPQALSALAHTGTDATVPALAGAGALVLGGAVLYRRFRPTAGH
ncbi:chaplin [Streptomyces sp. ID05-39B]|uniref:chaplin n=1 Tax=Streptomyces sp. ID05-39B TaxID=3028664 RepID=UPI00299FBBE9|nr:chaplin [Streptomyces sp. ID05-39B]MDX3527893.1 chaplin [Streptomyces sp. ID05-39B]